MGFGGQDSIDSRAPVEMKGKEFLEKTLVLTWKKQNENSNNYFLFSGIYFKNSLRGKKVHKENWVYTYI